MVVGKTGPRKKPRATSAALVAAAVGDPGEARVHHAARAQADPVGDRADQEPAGGQSEPETADRIPGERPAQAAGLYQVAEAPVTHADFQADVDEQHRRAA
jgi:hypothetical protein